MKDNSLAILFQPLVMPNMTLKNRFFMAPMGTTYSMDQLTDYFVARAKGDVALITTGEIRVHPTGGAIAAHEPSLERDDDIEFFRSMVASVQKAGAKIVAQLNHAGRYSFGRYTGRQSVAPSPVASRYTGETPRELTTGEVDELVLAFAEAALRARKAGFDGIEICGCSGYLVSQFLSPVTNLREDKYGGDIIGRSTFLLDVLRETRRLVEHDFNICVKFDGEDGVKGGKTLEDSLILAPKIVEAGADRLHVWAGWHEAARPMLPMSVPRGAFAYLARSIKNVVDVPVSTVGRINDPLVAAQILTRGDADLIGLARPLLCDPEFVKKTREGRLREIRRCTACCHCFDQIMKLIMRGDESVELKCAINHELGREGENLVNPTAEKKRMVIIGGGPAGMEAARVASLRGHDVTLFEKNSQLGGMLNVAVIPPHKGELKNLIDYLSYQMEILSVDVRCKENCTPEKLSELKPDVVVMALGAKEIVPAIPGIERGHVATAIDVLKGSAEVGQTVVIIGGGLIGVETAEYLADKGKEVTVVEMLPSIASDVGPSNRWGLLSRLNSKVAVMTDTKVIGITNRGVIIRDRDNKEAEIDVDSVIIAVGLIRERDLEDAIKKSGIKFLLIGSCREPGQIAEAMADGFAVGCSI
ncbi:MAG TPA: FAD-dependent oxidoreductase [Deltaproteobacteria bacterium]|nr:FAD-dependent oxidoreductase [Deltaproteobacteria bacterium]